MLKLTVNPKEYDNEKDFLAVCIPAEIKSGKEQSQATAICYQIWQDRDKQKMSIKLSLKLDKTELANIQEFNQLPEEKLIHEIIICELKSAFIEKYGKELPFTTKYFDEIINNFGNKTLSNPKLIANHNGESIKYADIIGLRYDDTWLYARVKLSYNGYMSLARGDFDYISPHFGKQVDTDGKQYNNTLIEVSFTNFPALCGDLPPIPDQIKLTKGNTMDALKKLIEYFTQKSSGYKLAKEDNERQTALAIDPSMLDGILAGLKDIMTQIEGMMSVKAKDEEAIAASKAEVATLTKELEVYKNSKDVGISEAVTVELTKLTNEINNVRTELKTKTDQIELMKKESLKKEASEYVTEQIKLGRIDAVNADFWSDLYLTDSKKVIETIGKLPRKDGSIQLSGIGGQDSIILSKEEKEVMEFFGLDSSDPKIIKSYKDTAKGDK